MKLKKALPLLCLLVLALLLPRQVQAAETAGKFVLAAEAGGQLVIAPEYISYTEGQTIGEALECSGHTFTGMGQGLITAIDDVTGNYTRSDQNGNYDLSAPASSVTHFRFSEEISGSQPSQGMLQLMTAMADFLEKEEDVQKAAQAAYDAAGKNFAGCGNDDARTLAYDLNAAMEEYEETQKGTRYGVRFTDGSKVYSSENYPGVAITAENPYGKVWTDEGDGTLELPVGSYVFCVEQDGLRVSGSIVVSADAEFQVKLPEDPWLKTDALRLSGSYGPETNEEHKFTDAEFTLGDWEGRRVTVLVPDLFSGGVYAYAEYDTEKLQNIPTISAVYTMTSTGQEMEKKLAFQSWNSGAYEVLGKGAEGNTVLFRLTQEGEDGYTYAQDYTVTIDRIPTLTSITVADQEGTDQAPTSAFSGSVKEYTYKVLDTTTAVSVSAEGLQEDYAIAVNGEALGEPVPVPVSGDTDIEVTVTAGAYSNTYTLTIQPGEGKSLSFISDKDVTIGVVNSNGVVMPFTTHRETDNQNRYRYTLVPGEAYSYIATKDEYYHIADDFSLEEVANSTITVDFEDMGDWLSELALGTASGSKYRGTLSLDTEFAPEQHGYRTTYVDTEHVAYLWVTGREEVQIQAVYEQVFSDAIYHGEKFTMDMVSGKKTGEKLNRFLMDENPIENTLTIRLTKEENGVTWYQDYVVEFRRELTLQDVSAKTDGVTTTLLQEDGTPGYAPEIRRYDVMVSMAAQNLELNLSRYEDNTCFGEEEVGYEILVDGLDVTESGYASITLDGTMNTQVVTIAVQNEKAPEGTGIYTLNILKSPPVAADFQLNPAGALLNIYEVLSGERVWPDENGAYQLCEGYSYVYTLTEYGYVGKSGTLDVTRNEENELVVQDGTLHYPVTESDAGGTVTISWELSLAPANTAINTGIGSAWPNFRGNDTNNAVTSARIPTVADKGTLYWANQMGSGYDADAVGSPILAGGDLITYAGDNIYRVDTVTGEVIASGKMDHKSSFSITPPAYAEGMVFVALSNGSVQAFNAATLESLWIYHDPLGGQPNCPLTVKDGYLYTGFWNSETGNANFVCLTITDEDPASPSEAKCVSWNQTAKGGYYWAGAYVGSGFVLVGTDDGTNLCNSDSSSLLLLDAKTGMLLDRRDGLNGDIRSTIVYDSVTDAYYFTAKGGSFYSVQVSGGNTLANMWAVTLKNTTGGIPMSTCSPVVYNGRAYVGVSGSSQFGAYSGHNITVVDLSSKTIAYTVQTQGYPQTSGLLTTAYESESGYVYVYFFDNMTPGKLRVLRDRPGMTAPDYTTDEKDGTVAYALFTPTGDQAQYAICSPIVDEYGTIYFKNDSAHLMAFGSGIEKIEVTTAPGRTSYVAGETFDPTGMVVTATYANGLTRDVTDYVSWSEEPLTGEDGLFTISFGHVLYHNQEDGTQMLSGVAAQTPSVTLELTIVEGSMGDVDGNGKIELADARMILDHEAKLLDHGLSLFVADVSGDGVIDSNDAVLIRQYLTGKFTKFPAEE